MQTDDLTDDDRLLLDALRAATEVIRGGSERMIERCDIAIAKCRAARRARATTKLGTLDPRDPRRLAIERDLIELQEGTGP